MAARRTVLRVAATHAGWLRARPVPTIGFSKQLGLASPLQLEQARHQSFSSVRAHSAVPTAMPPTFSTQSGSIKHAIVLGAGVIGLTTALRLLQVRQRAARTSKKTGNKP